MIDKDKVTAEEMFEHLNTGLSSVVITLEMMRDQNMGSRELSLCQTKLEEALYWMNMHTLRHVEKKK